MSDQMIYIKHRRTGMYVARQQPKSLALHSYITGWRWVRSKDDATAFDKMSAIHPVLQMGIEASALPVDANDDFVPGVL